MNPQEVFETVKARWLMRWMMLEKAERCRELNLRWEGASGDERKDWSREDKRLRMWAFRKDEY